MQNVNVKLITRGTQNGAKYSVEGGVTHER